MMCWRVLIYLLLVWTQIGIASSGSLNEPITPIPPIETTALELRKASLGSRLFSDPRLSRNGQISCASCHHLSKGGADSRAVSLGVDGAPGLLNTPTVLNSSLNFTQFWNGRATNLAEQVDGPVQAAHEMGSSWVDVIAKLKSDSNLKSEFETIYPDGVTQSSIKDAIAAFEKTLLTPGARFDRYLEGDTAVLTRKEIRGYERFKALGCITCHQGVNVGGNMFQTMGVMGNYFRDRKAPITEADLGRFAITKNEADRHSFKVPSLRNVELTAPYFHDGSAKTLEDAIRVMAKYQLGTKLSPEEVAELVAFLKTLTGRIPQ